MILSAIAVHTGITSSASYADQNNTADQASSIRSGILVCDASGIHDRIFGTMLRTRGRIYASQASRMTRNTP